MIAEKIRKLLLNIDLKIVYAQGEKKVAEEDFRLNQKIRTNKNQQLAIKAKARKECYTIYLRNLADVKEKIKLDLEKVLSKYTPAHKRIWEMYFIERRSIDKIVQEVGYSRESVFRIVKKLKEDLTSQFEQGAKKKNEDNI